MLRPLTLFALFSFLVLNSILEAQSIQVVEAAREQIGVTTSYDPNYRSLSYPNGDIPRESGVCTDVVIRHCATAYNSTFSN